MSAALSPGPCKECSSQLIYAFSINKWILISHWIKKCLWMDVKTVSFTIKFHGRNLPKLPLDLPYLECIKRRERDLEAGQKNGSRRKTRYKKWKKCFLVQSDQKLELQIPNGNLCFPININTVDQVVTIFCGHYKKLSKVKKFPLDKLQYSRKLIWHAKTTWECSFIQQIFRDLLIAKCCARCYGFNSESAMHIWDFFLRSWITIRIWYIDPFPEGW